MEVCFYKISKFAFDHDVLVAGVIDTRPVCQIKESRKLDLELNDDIMNDVPLLLELTDNEAPNILTNDPNFFISKKMDSQENKGNTYS